MLLILLPITIILSITLVVIYQLKQSKKWPTSFIVPPGDPLVVNALQFKNSNDSVYRVTDFLEKHGPTIRVQVGVRTAAVITVDIELIELVLSSNDLLQKAEFYHYVLPWLKMGLLTSYGNEWRKQRKMLTPAFHFEMLKNFIKVFERIGDKLVAKIGTHQPGEVVDVKPYVTAFTLEVICVSSMGTTLDEKRNEEYTAAVKRICEISLERCFHPAFIFDLSFKWTKTYNEQEKVLDVLHSYTQEVINERVQTVDVQELEKAGDKKKNFLDLLFYNYFKKKNLSYAKVKEEVDTFMFGGHDTTSAAIGFCLHSLSHHLEIQEKVLAEQKDLFGDEKNPEVTYFHLQEMKYLELVIKETIRLYPSIPLFGRTMNEDIKFGDGILPKGESVYISAYALHRNPKYFPEPNTFNPDRFLDPTWPNFAYIPFSAGPKNCIGQKYAMFELKSAISKLIRHYRFEAVEPAAIFESQLAAEIVLVNKGGIKARVTPR